MCVCVEERVAFAEIANHFPGAIENKGFSVLVNAARTKAMGQWKVKFDFNENGFHVCLSTYWDNKDNEGMMNPFLIMLEFRRFNIFISKSLCTVLRLISA